MSENIYGKISDLLSLGATVSGVDANDSCSECGHSWQDHHLGASHRPPTEGWIECPVAECTCYQTWSLPADTAEQVRKHFVAEE